MSLINKNWVFIYTAQKQEIKYQKNKFKIILKIKNIINFINICLNIFLDLLIAFNKFFSFLRDKIINSDKDNFFIIIFITEVITVEYNICGIWNNKFNYFLFIYILCIVSSVKKNALIVKYKEKDKINKDNLIEIKL